MQAQRLLSYGLDWRALFTWTLIVAAVLVLALASGVLLP